MGYTDGHTCVTAADEAAAGAAEASLLYGEVLPAGVAKLLDAQHCAAGAAGTQGLVDLGAGTGKLCLQAFLTYSNLQWCVGVELSQSRFALGERALLRLAVRSPHQPACMSAWPAFRIIEHVPGCLVRLRSGSRYCELRCGDLFHCAEALLRTADIVVLHTEFPRGSPQQVAKLARLLQPAKCGARLVTYAPLSLLLNYPAAATPTHSCNTSTAAGSSITSACTVSNAVQDLPIVSAAHCDPPSTCEDVAAADAADAADAVIESWTILPVNTQPSDTFSVSWSPVRGYHLYLYRHAAP